MTVFTESLIDAYRARVDVPVKPRKPRASVLAKFLGIALAILVRTAGRFRREALSIAGLGMLTAAAWTYTTWSGLAATGVACFVLEHLLSDD